MSTPSHRSALRFGNAGLLSGALGLLAGCSAQSEDSTETPAGERILALGDSYTAGTDVSNDQRWVNKLVEKRRSAGHSVLAPRVIAEDSWMTSDLNDGITAAVNETDTDGLADEYDLVTLLIGANNCFEGQSPGEFRPKFVETLARAITFAPVPKRVIVMTVPDYTLTPVGQQNNPAEHARRLTAYNGIIKQEAERVGARLVNVVPPSKGVIDRPELIANDDLHPAPRQYDRWLERIYPVADVVLSE